MSKLAINASNLKDVKDAFHLKDTSCIHSTWRGRIVKAKGQGSDQGYALTDAYKYICEKGIGSQDNKSFLAITIIIDATANKQSGIFSMFSRWMEFLSGNTFEKVCSSEKLNLSSEKISQLKAIKEEIESLQAVEVNSFESKIISVLNSIEGKENSPEAIPTERSDSAYFSGKLSTESYVSEGVQKLKEQLSSVNQQDYDKEKEEFLSTVYIPSFDTSDFDFTLFTEVERLYQDASLTPLQKMYLVLKMAKYAASHYQVELKLDNYKENMVRLEDNEKRGLQDLLEECNKLLKNRTKSIASKSYVETPEIKEAKEKFLTELKLNKEGKYEDLKNSFINAKNIDEMFTREFEGDLFIALLDEYSKPGVDTLRKKKIVLAMASYAVSHYQLFIDQSIRKNLLNKVSRDQKGKLENFINNCNELLGERNNALIKRASDK